MSGSGDAEVVNNGILARLEEGEKGFPAFKTPAGPRSGGSRLIAAFFVILGVGVALIAYQYQNDEASPVLRTPAQTPHPHIALSSPSSTVEVAPESLTARIINEPLAVETNASNVDTPGLAAGPANPFLAMNVLPEEQAVSQQISDKRLQSTPPRAQESPVSSLRPDAGSHVPVTVSGARHTPSGNPGRPAPDTEKQRLVTAKGQTSDRDVALLEALVAHVTAHPVQTAESPKKTPKSNPQPIPATLAKVGEHNRDIVERSPGDSTESLLRRCKQLGFLEGEFCRWRMCSGRWDSDPACKVANESQ